MSEFLATLCNSGEKASAIAVELKNCLNAELIESKSGSLKNEVAHADFKTFADVLIQQVITRDIEKRFSGLRGKVYGEETNKMKIDGKTIEVHLPDNDSNPEETLKLLETVMGSTFSETCKVICDVIHDRDARRWRAEDFPSFSLDLSNVAVWVDPIDATSQYIKGQLDIDKPSKNDQIHSAGLICVTCLIGAFDVTSGVPLIGVVSQPFAFAGDRSETRSKFGHGELYWGINTPSFKASNVSISNKPLPDSNIVATISREDIFLQSLLAPTFKCVVSSGAGFKILTTVIGLSQCNVRRASGTYFWDVCALHAIVCALGGSIVCYKTFKDSGQIKELTYEAPSQFPLEDVSECCLKDGYIIFVKDGKEILDLLSGYLR